MVFLTVVLTQLLAFVIVLVPLSQENYGFNYIRTQLFTDLAFISLFMQWVMLISMTVLCFLRRWLGQLSHILSGLLSYLLILWITGFVSECAWWVHESIAFDKTLFITTHYPFVLKSLAISASISGLCISYLYYRNLCRTSTLILLYVVFLIASALLAELASFFLSSIQLREQANQHQLFMLRNLSISAIISAIVLRYFYIQHCWEEQFEANVTAQLQALQSRIRPHFLFNSMNTIASLIRFQPDKAEQAIEDFAELFRASLSNAKQGVTFQQELELCEQYLRIESLRLGNRLKIRWNVSNIPMDALVPSLCLQPLLENAIYHGIQPLPEGGTIHITGLFDGKQVKIDIENPFDGIPSKHHGNQIAQHNIHQRLQTFYTMQAYLKAQIHDKNYQVTLRFPYRKANLKTYENLDCG
jgi:two-component system sensor histidine kinase AlgZ